MHTLLVLTDFSEAAMHASVYACKLAQQYNFNRIILYHNYEVIVPATDLPVTMYDNDDILYRQYMQQLAELRERLFELVNNSVNIETMTETGFLLENINSVAQKEMADIIVMGMRGKSKLEKILIGSNTVNVAEQSDFPLLIVPDHAPISPISSILFACDLKKITDTTPADSLSRILDIFQAKLHVLNVDNNNKHYSPETPQEISHLNQILNSHQPEYHFVSDKDVVSAIMQFARERRISLIITIPKKHGLFNQLFRRSISEKLIHHTEIPLLCLHE